MVRYLLVVLLFIFLFSPLDAGAWGLFSMLHSDKFDWLPTECAHRCFPMRLIEGHLTLKNGSSLYVPAKAIIHNGWGELGSTHVVGETMKALPVKLTATWFSFAENKFFSGEFILPYESILERFRTIMSHGHDKMRTSQWIVVGFGPEGAVSVWVSAEQYTVEVGKYKASEVTMDWKAVTQNDQIPRPVYIDSILKDSITPQQLSELKEHGVPSGISDYYSKQYRWELSVTGQINRMLWLKTLNGEEEYCDFANTSNVRPSRGLPKSLVVYWEDHTGFKYGADVRFDEAEVTAAYKKLSAETVDHPMQLKLDISDNPRVIHTSLNDGKYVILLNKTEVKAYSRN
jgi:hypothetical protein